MASFTYTYTLSNGSTADADEVMQNFNDARNGVTDGTKDISVAALTAAGTATLNGDVTLGNSSADDLTITASLAGNIPIKTTNTSNIGSSALGLASAYFGNAGGSTTIRVVSASSVAASRTYTLPDIGAAGTFVLLNNSKLGIGLGTTEPDTLVHIYGDQPALRLESSNPISTSSGTEEIARVEAEGTYTLTRVGAYIKFRQDGTWSTGTSNTAPSAISFHTQDSSTSDLLSTARMTITQQGDVGVGPNVASPLGRFHIYEEAPSSATDDMVYIQKNDTDADTQYIRFQQNTLASPLERGGIKRSGSGTVPAFYSSSDRRIKENIKPASQVLDRLRAVNVVDFDIKNDDANGTGVIAQELAPLFPELVIKTDDGTGNELPKGVEPWSVTHDWQYILIRAIQELAKKLESLEVA